MKALLKNIEFIQKCTQTIDVYTKIFENVQEEETNNDNSDCESSMSSDSDSTNLSSNDISSDDDFSINFDDK